MVSFWGHSWGGSKLGKLALGLMGGGKARVSPFGSRPLGSFTLELSTKWAFGKWGCRVRRALIVSSPVGFDGLGRPQDHVSPFVPRPLR